jgi:hypothetical protein
MLKAKLPKSDKTRKPTQPGDLSLEAAIRKHSKGSSRHASKMNAIAYKFPCASFISSGLKSAEYKNRPLTPNKPIAETHHNTNLCFPVIFIFSVNYEN